MWIQKEIRLQPRQRGFHLITSEIVDQVPELSKFSIGIAHIFIKHTSASLSLNENADPDVRLDMESHFNHMVPENAPYYVHTLEGSDDMPAHLKSTIIGSSVSVPISQGKFNLGIWQGIYFCEHRNHAGSRSTTVTLNGE